MKLSPIDLSRWLQIRMFEVRVCISCGVLKKPIESDQLKAKLSLSSNFGSLPMAVPEVDSSSSSKLKIKLDELKTKIYLLGLGVDRLNVEKVKGVNLDFEPCQEYYTSKGLTTFFG